LAVLLVLFAVAIAARGQERPQEPFQPGKTFFQVITITTLQNMTSQGKSVSQLQSITYYTSWTPVKRDRDTWQITFKIISLAFDVAVGGQRFTYSSWHDNHPTNQLTAYLRVVHKLEFTLTVGDNLELLKIDGLDQVAKVLPTNEQYLPLARAVLEESLKQVADPTNVALPTDLTAQGKAWQRTTTIPAKPANWKLNSTFTRKDKQDDLILIEVQSKAVCQEPDASGVGKRACSSLKITNVSGEIKFDITKGRIEESVSRIQMVGKLWLDVGHGPTNEVEQAATHEIWVRTSGTKPVPKR
jgi:hypothetical protein